MLRSLYIKNYALIKEVKVEFDRGLSIITGETGAGKSILLDAIGLLIGGRASADLIRRGESKAVVEAEYDISEIPKIKEYLVSGGIDFEDNNLIIRREINQKSAARAFINDSPANISTLKELGTLLIDLHGQHEHQSLLHPELHIDFLDEFAGLQQQRMEFQAYYEKYKSLLTKYEDLVKNKAQITREREFLEFQLNEIIAIDPKPNEDEEIKRELSILENSEELRDLSAELHDILYTSEKAVQPGLAKAKSLLDRLKKIDLSFAEQSDELQSAIAVVEELSHSISGYQ
ncbi:MAG: AAA family ATPase, partial [Ignavibacteriota bacterium]